MTPWRVAGAGLTAFALAAGSVSVWSWLARRDEVQRAVYDRPVTSLRVDLAGGDVTIAAGPPGRVTVDRRLTWSYGRPQVREEWTGTALAVGADCDASPRLPGCAVHYRIEAPPETEVEVRTGDGAVTVENVNGPLSLTTRSGPVRVSNARGTLRIAAADGNVTGTGLRSPDVTASAGNGGVDLTFAAPPVSVHATLANGDVTVAVPLADAYRLHASTRSGNRAVSVREDPDAEREIDVETADGDVRVGYGAP